MVVLSLTNGTSAIQCTSACLSASIFFFFLFILNHLQVIACRQTVTSTSEPYFQTTFSPTVICMSSVYSCISLQGWLKSTSSPCLLMVLHRTSYKTEKVVHLLRQALLFVSVTNDQRSCQWLQRTDKPLSRGASSEQWCNSLLNHHITCTVGELVSLYCFLKM